MASSGKLNPGDVVQLDRGPVIVESIDGASAKCRDMADPTEVRLIASSVPRFLVIAQRGEDGLKTFLAQFATQAETNQPAKPITTNTITPMTTSEDGTAAATKKPARKPAAKPRVRKPAATKPAKATQPAAANGESSEKGISAFVRSSAVEGGLSGEDLVAKVRTKFPSGGHAWIISQGEKYQKKAAAAKK